MKKSNTLFILWGIIVIILVGLLTAMGFILSSKSSKYEELEKVLVHATSSYVDHNFLYPEDDEVLKIYTKDLTEEFLKKEKLTIDGDTCTGYVTLKKDMVYEYKAYIKCKNYKTKGYDKN